MLDFRCQRTEVKINARGEHTRWYMSLKNSCWPGCHDLDVLGTQRAQSLLLDLSVVVVVERVYRASALWEEK